MTKPSIEVEMKARVDDRQAVANKISAIARPLDRIDYHDTYFTREYIQGYTHERFRLRETSERSWVTVKERLNPNTTDIKQRLGKIPAESADSVREHEFEVSDPEEFRFFAMAFGLKVMIDKHKHGERYVIAPEEGVPDRQVTVELIEVDGLGYFVEIEIMAGSPEEVPAASRRVMEVFRRLGIPDSAIEKKPYTLMLYELQSK